MSRAAAVATLAAQAAHKREVARLKVQHKKEIRKLKAKGRAKAKIQRAVSLVPVVGIAAFGIFEQQEYDHWKYDNPNGSFDDYTTEMSHEIGELLKTEYKEYYSEYQRFITSSDESSGPNA